MAAAKLQVTDSARVCSGFVFTNSTLSSSVVYGVALSPSSGAVARARPSCVGTYQRSFGREPAHVFSTVWITGHRSLLTPVPPAARRFPYLAISRLAFHPQHANRPRKLHY